MVRDKKWDQRFMRLAEEVSTWSKDPSTKVGAVIVDESRRIVGIGYNGFPRGVGDQEERYLDKSVKYAMIVHAEANAILNAIAKPESSLYCTKAPCSECMKLIIQCGFVKRIVSPPWDVDGKWGEDAKHAITMFNEARFNRNSP